MSKIHLAEDAYARLSRKFVLQISVVGPFATDNVEADKLG